MSGRSGSNSHRRHSREPLDDFPPLPVPRLPSLRALAHAQRDRDRDSPSPTSSNRPQSRHWSAAARRAERIRNLENRALAFTSGFDDFERPMDDGWPTSRRTDRMRTAESTRPANLEDLDRHLEEANSHLRALLDLQHHPSLTPPMPPNFSPPPRPTDLPDSNRRHKRRKLDSDRHAPFRSVRYGKYGQVEQGDLKMEIVSCDGGMFSNESSYAAENILKNDNSVYCTKGNRCNIVLRHQGGTVFTLSELVIKAPGSMNYSHPVREGMVFVAMTQDDVLNRTAQYQIQYAPRSNDPNHEGDSRVLQFIPTEIISVQHHENGTTTTRSRPSYTYRSSSDDYESRTPQMPREFASNLPDFQITTECSDDEEEHYEGSRLLYRRAPDRIGSLPFETLDSDSEEGGDPFNPEYLDDHHPSHWRLYSSAANTSGPGLSPPSSRRREREREREREQENDHSNRSFSLTAAWEAHASATQDAVRAVGGGQLLSPHARFYIEKKKSKCTIRFDPPVSGRFILLKMWSSHHDPTSNIDIQSVLARGFAGPRYFPSIELR
ncbi:uncharacterized protein FIESC28_01403 [Fusarium coffeatum]|uniref:Eukaryotic translation initiation factor 6 n=1 Tax=Fusarium coffeatum TaxID=231269 RepID=A0A366SAS3_9HYPO|nr:uncharacterized protein FIESC28_01403 [Fusarium coffeatum]RBR25810.1 hypothetical protein FIESC28_01403 [Fusarium coffeatum]